MTTLNTTLAKYIGNQLVIARGDYELPEGYTLPPELRLSSCWINRRGVVLGRSWYLQVWGDLPAGKSIDHVISADEIEGSYETMAEFLARHGYHSTEPEHGIYTRAA